MFGKRLTIGLAAGALVAAAVGGSAVWAAITSTALPPSTTFTGCLGSSSGSIYNVKQGGVSPLAPCTAGDSVIKLSAGDITAVNAGAGLTGGTAKGAAALALDPGYQLPQGCDGGAAPAATGAGSWACGTGGGKRFKFQAIPVGSSQAITLDGLSLSLGCDTTTATLFAAAPSYDGNFNILYGSLGGTVQDAGFPIAASSSRSVATDAGGTGTYVWDDVNGDVVTGTITWYDPGDGGYCQFAGDMIQEPS